jgi:hypothetical protein
VKFKLWLLFDPKSDRQARVTLIEGEALAGLCVVVAAVIALATDLGGSSDLSYYGTVAQVIPCFCLR